MDDKSRLNVLNLMLDLAPFAKQNGLILKYHRRILDGRTPRVLRKTISIYALGAKFQTTAWMTKDDLAKER